MMRDLLERSLWTGVEAGLAVISVEALTALDITALQTLLAAGIATVITALKVLSTTRKEQLENAD